MFSALRYKRRLVEIHVVWVNSLFLIFGSVLVILSYGSQVSSSSIDWMHLILFLIALRYAGSSLQEMASSTVAFSRFLPETELVHQILYADHHSSTQLNVNGLVFYFVTDSQSVPLQPYLMKLEYGVNNCVLLDESKNIQSIIEGKKEKTLWVYSSKPVKFYQAVIKNRDIINHVIIADQGKVLQFNNIDEFKQKFNPMKYKNKNQYDDSSFDDEMY
jgi:hypothetical protein